MNPIPLLSETGKPVSTTNETFFIYHLGNDQLGKELYCFYKQFFNKETLLNYGIETGLIPKESEKLVFDYVETVKTKQKHNHSKKMKTKGVRKKISDSYNRELQSEIKKKQFENQEFRDKFYLSTQNKESKEKRIKSYKKWLSEGGLEILKVAANKPERKKKISLAAKNMWKAANQSKVDKMLKNRYVKTISVNGILMNKPESILAEILTKLELKWEYENSIKIDKTVYIPDFFIPSKNLIVECYGDFWHAHPLKYEKDQILYEGLTVEFIQKRDETRKNMIEKQYKFLSFWEQELNDNNQLEAIKEKIKNV